MNKFSRLTEKLMKIPLWTSNFTLYQLAKNKNETGKIIFEKEAEWEVNGILTGVNRNYINNLNIFSTTSQITLPKNSLEGIDIQKRFKIKYNDLEYDVISLIKIGNLNNDCVAITFLVNI